MQSADVETHLLAFPALACCDGTEMDGDLVGRYRFHLSLCTDAVLAQGATGAAQTSHAATQNTYRDLFELSTLRCTGAATGAQVEQIEQQLRSLQPSSQTTSKGAVAAAAVALDPRLGRITLASLPRPSGPMPTAQPQSTAASLASDGLSHSGAASSATQTWRSRFTQSSSFLVEDEDDPSGKATTEVAFGILHLFREQQAAPTTDSGSSDHQQPFVALDDDSASTLAILGIPSQLTAADFLAWIEPALESVEKIRMIREGVTANRLTVLIKFRDPIDAEEFYKQYSGQPLPFARSTAGPGAAAATAAAAVSASATPPTTATARQDDARRTTSTSTSTSTRPLSRPPSRSSLNIPRACAQIVYVTQVTVTAGPTLPYAYPQLANSDPWPLTPSGLNNSTTLGAGALTPVADPERGTGGPSSDSAQATTPAARLALSLANELPTCPVCLERMDSAITGVMTVSCQHSFHCECLSRWGDGRCPVCRYSQRRAAKKSQSSLFASARRQLHAQAAQYGGSSIAETSHSGDLAASEEAAEAPLAGDGEDEDTDEDEGESESEATQCTVCGTTDDLWVCLICATVGCGRYKKGCAKRHFVESGHLYSLEVETSRVWDYINDGYIHRLIQNRADGKLVELPSTTSTAQNTPSRSSRRRRRHRQRSGHCEYCAHPGKVASSAAEATKGPNTGAASSSRWAASSSSEESDSDEDGDADEKEQKTGGKLRGSDAKLEAISLEYQYLLLSQLESQRSYYEGQVRRVQSELEEARTQWQSSSVSAERERELEAERASWEDKVTRSQEREKTITARCERALETSSKLSRDLDAERALSKGLLERLRTSQAEAKRRDEEAGELRRKCQDQEEQLRDLMFALEAQHKIQQAEQQHQRQLQPSQQQEAGAGRNDGGSTSLLHEARGGDLIVKTNDARRAQSQPQGYVATTGDDSAPGGGGAKKASKKKKKNKSKTATAGTDVGTQSPKPSEIAAPGEGDVKDA
ncbi:unnamed protein product [Parajaminaea phylloscopi]